MKLRCADENMPELVHALWVDAVPAVLIERTPEGWHVEFLRPPSDCPALAALVLAGTVTRG